MLGRAAVIVLRDHPSALHTCLTGPQDRRIAQAIALSGDDDDAAAVRKLVVETDRNRKAYFRHFYSVDPDDVTLYHLTLDSTVLDLDTVRRVHREGSSSPELELATSAGVSIGPES